MAVNCAHCVLCVCVCVILVQTCVVQFMFLVSVNAEKKLQPLKWFHRRTPPTWERISIFLIGCHAVAALPRKVLTRLKTLEWSSRNELAYSLKLD